MGVLPFVDHNANLDGRNAADKLWVRKHARMKRILLLSIAVVCCVLGFSGGTIHIEDIAESAGLTVQNTYGGSARKDFILETTGNGVAIFDYDGDGRNDIFIANGTALYKDPRSPAHPSQLYHNDGNGRFTEVGRN